MKSALFLSTVALVFLFSGCASFVDAGSATLPPSQNYESSLVSSNDEIREDKSASEKTELSDLDNSVQKACKQYAELYGSSHVFADMYMDEKSWLIGEDDIVQLISFAEFNDVTVLARGSVERIEQASFDSFATITIFDKTGHTISLFVLPKDLSSIVELLI